MYITDPHSHTCTHRTRTFQHTHPHQHACAPTRILNNRPAAKERAAMLTSVLSENHSSVPQMYVCLIACSIALPPAPTDPR